jgi:hypothetical protein
MEDLGSQFLKKPLRERLTNEAVKICPPRHVEYAAVAFYAIL